jgi:hypothetical protein
MKASRNRVLCMTLLLIPASLPVAIVFPSPFQESPCLGGKMGDSEIQRQGDSLFLDRNRRARRAYEIGVFLKGLEAISERSRDPAYH